MINGLRAPLFSDSFRGRKEVVPDTTTPLKWCRLSLFFVASHEHIHQGSNWYIYIYTVQSIIFPYHRLVIHNHRTGSSESGDHGWKCQFMCQQIEVVWDVSQVLVKHKYGFVWKQGTEISVGYHHFPNRIATEYSSFSDTPELPICIWSSYGCTHSASSISSLAKLVATWQFACAASVSWSIWVCLRMGQYTQEDWADPCFGNYASATMVLNPSFGTMLPNQCFDNQEEELCSETLNPNPTGNHT